MAGILCLQIFSAARVHTNMTKRAEIKLRKLDLSIFIAEPSKTFRNFSWTGILDRQKTVIIGNAADPAPRDTWKRARRVGEDGTKDESIIIGLELHPNHLQRKQLSVPRIATIKRAKNLETWNDIKVNRRTTQKPTSSLVKSKPLYCSLALGSNYRSRNVFGCSEYKNASNSVRCRLKKLYLKFSSTSAYLQTSVISRDHCKNVFLPQQSWSSFAANFVRLLLFSCFVCSSAKPRFQKCLCRWKRWIGRASRERILSESEVSSSSRGMWC